jgi:thiol-disulfide isomerase/thioredoxin
MKARLISVLFILTTSVVLAQIPEGSLSIEDQGFGNYFLNTNNIPVVKGRILKYSLCNPDSTKVFYSIVTPFGTRSQIWKYANVNNDGSFDLQLEYAFPYQQIWVGVGNLLYTCIYSHSNLLIELDADKLLNKKVDFNGDGVRFLGSDAKLNRFMNNHILFKRPQQLIIHHKINNLRFNRNITFQEFLVGYDSLMADIEKIDNEFITENPSDYAWIISNERMSQYYSVVCLKNWNKEMDNKTWEKVKNFKSYCISNDGVYFYYTLSTYLQMIANKNRIVEKYARGKNILDPQNRYKDILGKGEGFDTLEIINTIKNIELLDTLFSPPKADFLKMKIQSKDVKEERYLLELILKSSTTDWCKTLLNAEYKTTINKLDSINQILKQSKPVNKPIKLGQPVAELPFGAKLYKVSNIKASDFLSNLKQSFNEKALLIDFWATWCAPCIQEMPFSKKLQNEIKDLPVEFIYLCTSGSSSIDKWKSKISELQIPGTHIFVEETIETDLMNLFSVNGFPSYVFINTNGNFIPKAIERPSMTNKVKVKELLAKGGTPLPKETLTNQAKASTSGTNPPPESFEGIGIQFVLFSDTIIVRNPISGGPSEKVGILPADRIIFINDTLVAGKGISYLNVMRMLKGPKGSIVKIKVIRQGSKDLRPFAIIRDNIKSQ